VAFASELLCRSRDLGRAFASAAVAVHNMHLYESTRDQAERLDIAMKTRAVIEQAKGILTSQRRCDAQEASTSSQPPPSGPIANCATSRRPSSTA